MWALQKQRKTAAIAGGLWKLTAAVGLQRPFPLGPKTAASGTHQQQLGHVCCLQLLHALQLLADVVHRLVVANLQCRLQQVAH